MSMMMAVVAVPVIKPETKEHGWPDIGWRRPGINRNARGGIQWSASRIDRNTLGIRRCCVSVVCVVIRDRHASRKQGKENERDEKMFHEALGNTLYRD
jgi:hypothetical protein